MRKVGYRITINGARVSTDQQVLSVETREREQKVQTELDLWRQQVKTEAKQEAGRGKGTLSLGGIEALLKRVSEEVTIEAQERQRGRPNTVCPL